MFFGTSAIDTIYVGDSVQQSFIMTAEGFTEDKVVIGSLATAS